MNSQLGSPMLFTGNINLDLIIRLGLHFLAYVKHTLCFSIHEIKNMAMCRLRILSFKYSGFTS